MSTTKENSSSSMPTPTSSTPTATPTDTPDSSLPPQGTSKRKPTKPPSEVWDHFTKVKECDPNYPRATCNYCGIDYACHGKRNETSNMKAHLASGCQKHPFRCKDPKQKTLSFQSKNKEGEGEGDSGYTLLATSFNVEHCRKMLARMIIVDELAFRFVQGEGFRAFCSPLQPKFFIPSRATVAKDCSQLYSSEKKKLKSVLTRLSQKVCLTTDTWTSLQNLNYMVLTAHFLDDEWKLHKRILNFCQIPNHKGDTIGKTIEKCLLKRCLL